MAILNRPAPTRLVEVTGRLRFKKFAPIPGAGRGWILTDLPRPAPPIFTKMPLGFLFQTHTHTHIYISILSLQSSLHPPLSLSLSFLTPLTPSSYCQPPCQPPCRYHTTSNHADLTPPATTRSRQHLTPLPSLSFSPSCRQLPHKV